MFEIFDYRTGRRVGFNTYDTESFARIVLHTARENVRRGIRTDIAESVDYWDIREVDNVLYLTPAEVAQLDNLLDN